MTEKELSKYLFEKIGSINRYTVDERITSLVVNSVDSASFLLINFQAYPTSYTTGLLLTFPSLWVHLSLEDWTSIIAKIAHREMEFINYNPFKEINLDHSYGCLVFISKILNLDPIEFISSNKKMNNIEIIKCLRIVKTYPNKFLESGEELREDLADFYSISFQDLLFIRGKFPLKLNQKYKNAEELSQQATIKLRQVQ